MTDLQRAKDALTAIPPDLPRDDWVRAGMAAHAAGLGLDDFEEWSSGGSTYDPRATRDVWRSFKDGKGVGPGTLFAMAKQHGHQRINGHAKAQDRPPERAKPRVEGLTPAQLFERFTPATANHPYILAKQGIADGLRVVPEGDPLRLAGEPMAGALVIPVGDYSSLQFVTVGATAARLKAQGKATKLNLAGHSLNGWFTVGELKPGAIVYLCEGLGQASACWKATGSASLVCFGWGRVRKVAVEVLERDPAAQLVIVPDVGKEDEAEKIAGELGCKWVEMPAGWPDNSDVNDLAQREGHDVLAALLDAPKAVTVTTPAAPRFEVLTAAQVVAQPPQHHLIKKTIPANSVGAFVGASGSAKSFLVLHALHAISDGESWFDLRTRPGLVLYIGLEGGAGIANRVRALNTTGKTCDNLRFMVTGLNIRDELDRVELVDTIKATGLTFVAIAIDTLARSSPGADENSGQDMGQIIAALTDIQQQLGATVIAVHHTGKDSTKGPRGHSSLLAALDFAIEVRRDGDLREWQLVKAKDAADGDIHPFSLRVVELGDDEDGDKITSCIVHEMEHGEQQRRPTAPSGGNQRLAWLAVTDLIKASQEFGKGAAPSLRKCITLEAAIEATCQRLACEPKRRRERATTAITGLASRGCIGLQEEVIWLI